MSKAVVDTIRSQNGHNDGITTLSTGVRAQLVPLAPNMMHEVVSNIKEPKIPVFFNEEKGRDEENPNDPDYLEELKNVENERTQAIFDACLVYGVELADGMPTDDTWLKKLQYLEKRKRIDLSLYDLTDPMELEYVYKRYKAVGASDYEKIFRLSGITEEVIAKAGNTFPGDKV